MHRRPRSAIAIAAGWLLAVLFVVPVAADDSRLSGAEVSPGSGTTATTFTLAVTYRAPSGREPIAVSALVGAATIPLTPGHDNWKAGVRFAWAGTLAVGTHDVAFRAVTSDRHAEVLAAGSVTVTLPPTPKPTPAPTPAPTQPPKPTPPPPAATPTPPPVPPAPTTTSPPPPATGGPATSPDGSTAGPGSTAVPGTWSPGDPSGPAPAATAPPITAGGPTGGGPNGGSPNGGGPTAGGPGSGGPGTGDPGIGGPGPGGGGPGAGVDDGVAGPPIPTGGWGDMTQALEVLGLDATISPELRLIPALVGSAGAVTMLMAFAFFGKKRRDGQPTDSDEVLEARAARGLGDLVDASLALPGGPVVAMPDAEAAMPRWRRPSLLEARRADPLRNAAPAAERQTFAHGLVDAVAGRERRLIRYTLVDLLDQPDELRASKIGTLQQGDEVQLIERSGSYWLVLCPDGRQGWLHRTTLGEVVGGRPAPMGGQVWATDSFDEEVDDDVLAAFMNARARA